MRNRSLPRALFLCIFPLALHAADKISYLALGDSVTFGYSPLVTVPLESNYSGYPEGVASLSSPLKWETSLACPGETSGSFLSATAPDRRCREFKSSFGLHTNYTGTQMQEALALLNRKRQDLKLVTVQLGANDLLMVQEGCNFDAACTAAGIPATVEQVVQNLVVILTQIRSVYNGRLVLVNYYSPDYRDPLQVAGVAALQAAYQMLAPQFNATVADAFTAFADATVPYGGDTCAAGLLVQLPDGTCDMHPSEKGRQLLAQTVVAAWR